MRICCEGTSRWPRSTRRDRLVFGCERACLSSPAGAFPRPSGVFVQFHLRKLSEPQTMQLAALRLSVYPVRSRLGSGLPRV